MLLLKSGADAKVKDKKGKTAFEYARTNEKLKGSRICCARGSDKITTDWAVCLAMILSERLPSNGLLIKVLWSNSKIGYN